MKRTSSALRGLIAIGIVAPWMLDVAAQSTVPTYTASYQVEYKGRRAGTSQFSVRAGAGDGSFTFESSSKLKGLVARLVAPRPIVEHSRFTYRDGRLQPIEFRYEDGSRKGEDNYTIAFADRAVTLTTEHGPRQIEIDSPALDRGSAQVAMMVDGIADAIPERYRIIDDDGLEIYEVTEVEPDVATTGIGEVQTRRFAQQRVGSSRSTIFWLSTEHRFLPVRIEQFRGGEVRFAFTLQSVAFD